MLVGMELEVPGLPKSFRETIRNLVPELGFEVHDDNSVRVDTFSIGGIALLPDNDESKRAMRSNLFDNQTVNIEHFGFELVVNPPKDHENLLVVLAKLERFFSQLPYDGKTGSIHFHIDVRGKPWRYVQNVVRWFYHLELPLYTIACGGKDVRHRGETNSYKYTRSLSQPIYCTAPDREKYVPILDIDLLLAAATATDFAYHWGRLDYYWENLPHYTPHRLHGLNLAAVRNHGALEWRLFNGIPQVISDFLRVVIAIHLLAEKTQPDFEPCIFGSEPMSREDVEKILGVPLHRVWSNKTPKPPEIVKLNSHYGEFVLPSNAKQKVRCRGIDYEIAKDTGLDAFSFF